MVSTQNILLDKFGRKHDYLRISLTDRCNLRCVYCMPPEGVPHREKAEFMTSEEVIAIAKEFVNLGINKIRITGGEPLIKKDIANILTQLSGLPVELTMTTNGVLIDKHLSLFKEIGLTKINVSLDSLQEAKNNKLTLRNHFQQVMDNIELLLVNNFKVKLNCVLIKGENDNELIDFIEFTKNRLLQVRYIEFMPFAGNDWQREKTMGLKEIISTIEQHYGSNVESLKGSKNDTTKNFKIKGFMGSFGIISTVTNPFCDTCNRIRLTADGKIKNCLFGKDEIDLLSAFRNQENISNLIRQSIFAKHESLGGNVNFDQNNNPKTILENRSMVSIGG